MTSHDFDQQVISVAALGEPIRRELYRYVVAQPDPVSREGAAAGVGVAQHVAKFHLDKLEADGLLDAEYRRPPGRTGPGAGRPAKLYRRSARHIAVSLPERRYDLAGQILAEAITTAQRTGLPPDRLVTEAALAAGRALGEQARQATGQATQQRKATQHRQTTGQRQAAKQRQHPADPLAAAGQALAANGYEPRLEAGRIMLANCPFHDLAEKYPALVCGLNVDLINGLLETLPAADLCATLDPGPGRCCVTVGSVQAAQPTVNGVQPGV